MSEKNALYVNFCNQHTRYSKYSTCASISRSRFTVYGVLNHPKKGEYDIAGPLSQSIGNGNCENWLNNVECNYDGGDCCATATATTNDLGFCINTKGTHHIL